MAQSRWQSILGFRNWSITCAGRILEIASAMYHKVMPDYTPQRVVSLQPSATLVLAEIGMLDRVVACTKYCVDVCPQVVSSGKTIVADSWTAKSAEILSANPDLVIASVPYQENAVVEILRSGVPFLGFAPKTLADIYKDIAAIAGVMGVPERGTKVVASMQIEIETVRSQAQSVKRPRVYCEEWGKPLIASQRWVAELIEIAGGEFIGAPGAHTTAEAVAAQDPDIIIASWCGAGDRVPLGKLVRDRGWSRLRAAQTRRIACIRDEFLNTPAPSLLRGLRALAAAIHPDRYPPAPGLRWISSE
jgi:iron complex transport system substrate-binding protein